MASDPREVGRAVIAAREALDGESKAGDEVAAGDDAEVALTSAMERELKNFAMRFKAIDSDGGVVHIEQANGIAAGFLRGLGDEGPEAADLWIDDASTKLSSLASLPPEDPAWEEKVGLEKFVSRVARTAARVLWRSSVRDEVENGRKSAPALAYAVHEHVLKTHRPGLRLDERDGQLLLFDQAKGRVVTELERLKPLDLPALELATAERLLPAGAQLLGSVKAHRLLRFEVATGHRQYLAGNPDARAIRIEGGWEALPEAVGMKRTSDGIDDLRRIVVAQAHLCFRWPDGTIGNMLSYNIRPAAPGRRGMLSLILGDPLMPMFTFACARGTKSKREARRLVPMVDLPPLVGRPNDHGPQASFQLAILGELRRRAIELVERGGVRLDVDDLDRLAVAVALPRGLVPRVLDRWTQDGDDGPAFLERIAPDTYTLAKAHTPALAMLQEAGLLERRGAAAGKRGAARRRAGRFAPGKRGG